MALSRAREQTQITYRERISERRAWTPVRSSGSPTVCAAAARKRRALPSKLTSEVWTVRSGSSARWTETAVSTGASRSSSRSLHSA